VIDTAFPFDHEKTSFAATTVHPTRLYIVKASRVRENKEGNVYDYLDMQEGQVVYSRVLYVK